MTAQTGFSHIVIGSAPEEEETVIQAGCGYAGAQDSATEGVGAPAAGVPAELADAPATDVTVGRAGATALEEEPAMWDASADAPAAEEEPAVALPAAAAAPTRAQTARRSAASNNAQTSQKKATGKKTADGLEPMSGTQKTVIIGAVLLVAAFVVYYCFFM